MATSLLYLSKLNKMALFGFDKDRFPNLNSDMFDCPICTNVVRQPKECTGCGDLFCSRCIDDWTKKNNSCPKRCNGGIQPMTSKALIRMYEDLDIKCSSCKKNFKLSDISKHQFICSKPKCWNSDICSGILDAEFGKSCSDKCQLLQKLLATGGNVKQMYQVICKYEPKQLFKKGPESWGPGIQPPQNPVYNGMLKWSNTNCGQGLTFQKNDTLIMLKQPAYVFRTAVASTGFTSGQNYWEIIPDPRTENQLKIGVVTSLGFDLNTAFCDHVFGFAYYGLGQLRHGSNASGAQYGKRLKKQGVLGIFLNMDKGTLSFSLNGENMGVAFDNAALKVGPIYPAVALLHCAGCTIRGGLPIPNCFK